MNMKLSIISIVTATVLLTGCSDKDSSQAQVVEQKQKVIQNEKNVQKEETNIIVEKKKLPVTYTKYEAVVQKVFKDVAKVAPDGKQMILVFGTNTDPYTDRLKADITNSPELQKKLKDEFSSYYFKAHENLRHKQFHQGELMDVDTKTMIMIYGIESTPTILFTDIEGKAVLVVPGYIPTKQFLVTMDFMAQGKWKGKDRKNGEVYEALRDFYIENGIEVTKKKAE